MSSQDISEAYILDNFEKAAASEYIKVYYQPVIRTISRKMCGFEALARWEDPEKGMISPASFISVLENNRLIHLLDSYIIRNICKNLRHIVNNSYPILPVSFNISRLDFEICDMFSVVDNAVNEYEIPHDLIYIEITESMINEKTDLIIDIIEKFRNSGYQVWMDDFGSGYSSLNALKDYNFNTLKIDMCFLSDLNSRSRAIVCAVVEMSKNIGIKTLAEGVETEEQYDFLKYIGCEKVQGYYFSRPLSFDRMVSSLIDGEFGIEELWERKYYDNIGLVNVLSSTPFILNKQVDSYILQELDAIPIAIVEIEEGKYQFLYKNETFIKEINALGIEDNEEDIHRFVSMNTIFLNRLSTLFRKTRITGNEEITIADNGKYFVARTQLISRENNRFAILFTFQNITRADSRRQERLDELLRNVYSIYDSVFLIDITENLVERAFLFDNLSVLNKSNILTIEEFVEDRCRKQIHKDDLKGVEEFFDFSNLKAHIQKSGRNFISRYFRIKNITNGYDWKICTASMAGENEILLLIRNADNTAISMLNEHEEYGSSAGKNGRISKAMLWQSLMENSSICFFWKDKDRRFLGANRAFLDYYGMPDMGVILNKNDEEVGWHVEPGPYKSDEERVISDGFVTHDVPGHCIIRGIERDIIANKMPIYDDGSIVGLVGYFRDVTDIFESSHCKETGITDNLTGLLNGRGIMLTMLRYTDAYELRENDFALILIRINNFNELKKYLGLELIEVIIQTIGNTLKKSYGNTTSIGRYSGDEFIIIFQFAEIEEVAKLKKSIIEHISEIHSANGNPCTLYASAASAIYSETGNSDKMIKAAEKELGQNRKKD